MDDQHTPAGSRIGPYLVRRKLGEGGMGAVYLAHDSRLGRDVALKRVAGGSDDPGSAHHRLLREARAVAQLNHPGIASVHDVIEVGGQTYIVMEYVDGETLAARIARGRMGAGEVVGIARQLADALTFAHARGIIHRDLKPSNIQITATGTVKVLDFGLARVTESAGSADDALSTQVGLVTAPGAVVGTPAYMSPEQVEGQTLGPATDIFSLGVVVYEMLSGTRPFRGTDSLALAVAVVTRTPPDLETLAPDAPPALIELVRAMLTKPSEERPTAAGVRSVLDRIADGRARPGADRAAGGSPQALLQSAAPGSPARWPRRRVAILAASLCAVLALAGWAGLRWLRPGNGDGRRPVIAVLPPVNLSGDPKTDQLGAALTSVLIRNLGTLPGVTCLARSLTAPYTGEKRADLPKIARDIGATVLIDLALSRSGQGVKVDVKLVSPAAPDVPWTGTYERDALGVQRDVIAGLIDGLTELGAIRRKPSAQAREQLLALPTTSSAAFDAYAEARLLLDRRDVPGNLDNAVRLMEEAVARDPSFALAYAGLTDAYAARYTQTKDEQFVAKAASSAARALELDPRDAAVRYSLANLRKATGNPAEAIKQLRLAISLQPDNDDAHRLLGLILAGEGKVDEGIAEVKAAVRIRPEYGGNYNTLGFICYKAGRYQEALEAYRRVTELQPDFPGGYQMLGTTYHVLGDVRQAVGNYEHAVRLGPSATAWANLAFSYYAAGRLPEALSAYQESLKRDARTPETHRDLGDVLARMGRADEARRSWEQAVALIVQMLAVNAKDAKSIALLALCEVKLGRGAQAERHAAEALALAPSDKDVVVKNAEVAARLGRGDAAVGYLAQAVARGYQPAMLRDNDELISLRPRPDFQLLLTARSASTPPQGQGASK